MHLRALVAFAFSLLLPVSTAAQEARPRLEIGADLTHWRLDAGTASSPATTRWGSTLRLALHPAVHASHLALQLSGTYAPAAEMEPGLRALELDLLSRVRKHAAPEQLNLFVALGAGALYFDAERQEAALEGCSGATGCLFEGIGYRTGWRAVLGAGIGADVPLGASLLLQPQARVLKLAGRGDAGGEHNAMLRVGVGVALRR